LTDPSLDHLLEFATDLAWRAGRMTLARFQNGTAVEWKADASPVTAADREAEQFVREQIEKRFPGDAIVGEEYGTVRGDSDRRWIIDPIDGTRSFIHGVPLYGTLLALEIRGDPVLGVIRLPALDETVAAATGLGCWWNGRRAYVSKTTSLADALILTSDPATIRSTGRAAAWDELAAASGTTRTWGDCYGYALVATGRAEAMIDPILSLWDAAAVAPIVREAGGAVTDLDGRPRHDSGHLLASNGVLADRLLDLLRETP
jgi:histidinol phosphatase-like enzyme (inositol monophosphatase family)